ncbi:hypothetical protein BX616_000359 [Lobosporangium transversale]|nr:hypothetical protein BX616_000359 [Lobosporangium transversale]
MVTSLWTMLRKRRQQQTKTSPSMPSKINDFEQQHSLHSIDDEKLAMARSNGVPRNSTQITRKIDNIYNLQSSRPSTPKTPHEIPPRTSSSAQSTRTPSIHSVASTGDRPRSIEKKKHRRQASTNSLSKTPSPSSSPVPPPTPTRSTTSGTPPSSPSISSASEFAEARRKSMVEHAIRDQPTDCHIDMLDVDVETLMPIIISEEIHTPIPAPLIRSIQAQQPKNTPQELMELNEQQDRAMINKQSNDSSPNDPIISMLPIMPTPTPRRPPLVLRKSTDNHISGRISMSHLPPPPPPSVPPPAIPSTSSGSTDGISSEAMSRPNIHVTNANATTPTRGQRPRALTESNASIRSISLDSSNRQEENSELHSKSKTKRVIMPPSNPPPASPSSSTPMSAAKPQQSQIPVHVRRKGHQKTPSQIMSTGFFASPERSPLSPLSPPHSPMTIQIPRKMQSSRSSFVATAGQPFPHHTTTNVLNLNRPDSPTAGLNNPSPTSVSQQGAVVKSNKLQYRRAKSKSISQAEAPRILASSSLGAMTVGCSPRSPSMPLPSRFTPNTPPMSTPSSLADHLPLSPVSHAQLMKPPRPSLATYQGRQASFSSWDSSSRASTATPTAASSSTGADDSYWAYKSSPTSPTSPNYLYSPYIGGTDDAAERYSIISSDRTFDVKTIISDALAIAMAKSAAAEAARRQQQNSASLSRPWAPLDEMWANPSV